MAVHWKPQDKPTMTPAMPGGRKLIDFVTKVFGAKIQSVYEGPGGAVLHAEIRFGDDSLLMTGDPMEEHVIPPGSAHAYVSDVDAAYKRALEGGAKSKEEPKTQFYGDRTARVIDPFGNQWSIATHVEDVSDDELKRRMDAMTKGAS